MNPGHPNFKSGTLTAGPRPLFLLQNVSVLPQQKGLEIPGGWGGEEGGGGLKGKKNLKESMKVNWNIQRGGAIIGKFLFLGEV